MMQFVKRAWADVLLPILPSQRQRQVAALCYRETEQGTRVLLITSRDTGRWIVPKGWPIEGLDDPGSALQEAWEEAGVSKADIESDPVGAYDYLKAKNKGPDIPVKAQVYLTRVRNLEEDYPEAHQRKRAWFAPAEAANLVDEPDLKEILAQL